MTKINKRRFQRITLRPAAAVIKEPVKITVIDYDEMHYQYKEVVSPDECQVFRDKPTVTWINVEGIHRPEILEKIASCFNLHPLILEDIGDVEQRPKMEDLENYIYVVLKMLSYDTESAEIEIEQISLVVGNNFVISFQETVGDVFDPIRERIKNSRGRIRKMGADYLGYVLVDAIVDNYLKILDEFGEKIEFLEEEIITRPDQMVLKEVYHLKREIIFLRKVIFPLKEMVRSLERSDSALIKDSTRIYFRDIYDHVIQVADSMEMFREMLTGMVEAYLSSLSNKLNEVMKVLTIIATIFMPLTFVTGIFGMNFRFIPGLERVWGFPVAIILMLVIGIYMLRYFKKQNWI
ncbi:MAG: magnesium/cobalt transporter CorA [Candidatus Omnitrophica bacterium]|nr:magnesium/cobalt transporter CorA [Candidatus Omnitrophota bacterium]